MSVLVSTADGCHEFTSSGDHTVSLRGRSVAALTPGPSGEWMGIVDRRELCRRNADGTWTTLATTVVDLSALTTAGDVVFAGTVGAHMLRLRPDSELEPLPGFDTVTGRDHWHGVGGPIEVRSLTATVNGEALLANVHVGGHPALERRWRVLAADHRRGRRRP